MHSNRCTYVYPHTFNGVGCPVCSIGVRRLTIREVFVQLFRHVQSIWV